MADISQITLPSNQVFNIKDSTARQGLSTKVDIAQGSANANKYLATDSNGNVIVQELLTASSTVLGAVKPVTKTVDMTQAVGVDANGLLYTNASAQSDWNENDSTDPAYIQNRTHYKTSVGHEYSIDLVESYENLSQSENTLSDINKTYSYCVYTDRIYLPYLNADVFSTDTFADINTAQTTSTVIIDGVEATLTNTFISDTQSKLYCYNNDICVYIEDDYGSMLSLGLYTNSNTVPSSIVFNLPVTNEVFIYSKLDSRFLNGKLITEGTGRNSEIFNNVISNVASGSDSHAEGSDTTASGNESHAEGYNTTASGSDSHAEGNYTTASGIGSHAEGWTTTASGISSHAEGWTTTASGDHSHAEGTGTTASGYYSHAEGIRTKALGNSSHAEGGYFTGTSSNDYRLYLTGDANATTYTVGSASSSWNSLINLYINNCEIINEQIDSTTNKITSITLSETLSSTAISNKVYYLQTGNVASGINAHTEGNFTVARNSDTHAEGYKTVASGKQAHAEGYSTTASGDRSHTEGAGTKATGVNAHAEGGTTVASNSNSHAEGFVTTASGINSHAEGNYTIASGDYSHVEGHHTIANHASQHVFGEYNVEDPSTASTSSHGNYVEIVGKGTSNSARSNARTLDWSGNEVLAGKLTVGTGPTANMDVATKQYVDAATAGVSPNLSGLADTTISSPANGQVLKYDSTSSKWVNGDADNIYFVNMSGALTSLTADKTFSEITSAVDSGKQVIAVHGGYYYYYTWKNSTNIIFNSQTLLTGTDSSISYRVLRIQSDETITYYTNTLQNSKIFNISSPATGQILTYDGTTSKWVNTTSPYMTASQVNELITAALAEYGDGDTASYGFEDASEVSY